MENMSLNIHNLNKKLENIDNAAPNEKVISNMWKNLLILNAEKPIKCTEVVLGISSRLAQIEEDYKNLKKYMAFNLGKLDN